jgi:hypothetical protein
MGMRRASDHRFECGAPAALGRVRRAVRRACGAILLLAAPAAGQGVDAARLPLSEVMPGATSITFAAPALLFVAPEEAGYACLVSITAEVLEAIAQDRLAAVARPEATCIDSRFFALHGE